MSHKKVLLKQTEVPLQYHHKTKAKATWQLFTEKKEPWGNLKNKTSRIANSLFLVT